MACGILMTATPAIVRRLDPTVAGALRDTGRVLGPADLGTAFLCCAMRAVQADSARHSPSGQS